MTERGRDRLLLAATALCAFATAWIATDPHVLMTLNWDNSSYISSYASGQWRWSTEPWNSHFGIGQVYLAGVAWVRLFGGTYLDGFRFANGVALTIGAVLVADSVRRMSSRLVGFACAFAFVLSWGSLQLVCTVEDNVLFVPEAAGILALCLRRIDGWRAQDSVLAGAIVAVGILMSWQAGAYLGPALYVAMFQGGPRPIVVRIRDVAIMVAAMLGAMVLWCVLLSFTSHDFHIGALVGHLFSRPEPSFFPRGAKAWIALLVSVDDSMVHTGHGVLQEVGPALQDSIVWSHKPHPLGVALFVFCAVLALGSTALWLRDRRSVVLARLQFLCVTLLALTFVTALYRDLVQDKYKRYDYVPLVLAHIVGALAGYLAKQRARRLQIAAVLIGLFALVEGMNGVRWVRAWHDRLHDRYYGIDHVSWMGYVRDLRRANPQACTFVFALPEVSGGQWNHETTAALASELPAYVVLSDKPVQWKKPLHTMPAKDVKLTGCEWVSPEAKALLR